MNTKVTLVLLAGLLLSGPVMAQAHISPFVDADAMVAVGEDVARLFERSPSSACGDLQRLTEKWCEPSTLTDLCIDLRQVVSDNCSD